MSKAGFTFDAVDPGDVGKGNVILVEKKLGLVPEPRRRTVVTGSRPGTWDFGSELDERAIELAIVSGDNGGYAGTDTEMRALADLFDPTNEVGTDKGFKQLIFDSQTDRYWLAKLINGPFPEYLPTAGRLVLTLRCSDPFAYSTAQYVVSGGSATITGFSAYRQAPEKINWNLVRNGGFVTPTSANDWASVHANASRVADAASPSGWALRIVATGAGQYTQAGSRPIEAGKTYSFALQARGDGSTIVNAFIWRDAAGLYISESDIVIAPSVAAYTEYTLANVVAPGNARYLDVWIGGLSTAGIGWVTCVRVKQQVGAPAAWTAADQQNLTQKGLEIYEASTNMLADGDMEAVGVASWAANVATLTKDATNPFTGTKRLKVVTTAASGSALQQPALAAGQPVTASVRCIGGDGGAGLKLESLPSGAVLGTDLGASADYTTRRVSGVVAVGDTSVRMQLIGGVGVGVTSYFDNACVENKAYDTMNADPSGQAFALGARTVSSVTLPTPAAFDAGDFAVVGVSRLDQAYNGHGTAFDRFLFDVYIDAVNRLTTFVSTTGIIAISKVRAGAVSQALDGGVTAFAAGDTIAWAVRFSPLTGLALFVSKNGGAVATYVLATPEALLAVAGVPTLFLGRYGGAGGYELDGTMGVLRILKGGQTDATIAALVANPYQQQDETYELAVWRFEGAAAPEDFASNTLSLEVGGNYWIEPAIELTAGGAYTGNIIFTDTLGNALTWNGTVALNDMIRLESDVLRIRKNGVLAMSGVQAGSKWPRFRGGGLRDSIVVTGIGAANIKALTATYRHRWI